MTQTAFEQEVLERLSSIEATQDIISHALLGNGQQGLIKDVAELRAQVDERTSPRASKREMASVSGLVTAVLIAVIEFLRQRGFVV